MTKYRNALPQLSGQLFLTDGGIETTLIFHEGLDLPEFATFVLLDNKEGRLALKKYFRTYADLAYKYQVGSVLETATWRANPDWARKLGYSAKALHEKNQQAVALLEDIRNEYEAKDDSTLMVISGCLGPRDDAYNPNDYMSVAEAADYHSTQINSFSHTKIDLVTAITMTYTEEAIGIVQSAKASDLPVVISFTVETDGTLPSGQSLKDAIHQVDRTTAYYPVYYMINCAHPTHFENILTGNEHWLERIGGVRANASILSHSELDEAEELDDGNPEELGQQYKTLRNTLKQMNVLGGCCGTDHRHIEAIIKAVS